MEDSSSALQLPVTMMVDTNNNNDNNQAGECRQQQRPAPPQDPEIQIKIVSATYGPCEGLRLPTGELTNDKATSIPLSRDVAPFLRALLIVAQRRERRQQQQQASFPNGNNISDNNINATAANEDDANDADMLVPPHIVRVRPPTGGGRRPTKPWIYVLGGGNPMNAAFGDPCPGISKRLEVHYIVTEALPGDNAQARAAKTEIHHVSFAEHEMVVFRRRLTFFQDDDDRLQAAVQRAAKKKKEKQKIAKNGDDDNNSSSGNDDDDYEEKKSKMYIETDNDDDDDATLQKARKMGRSQSIAEIAAMSTELSVGISAQQNQQQQPLPHPNSQEWTIQSLPSPISPSKRWRLRSAVSEIVVPLLLPFLDVQERVRCRLICRSWQHVVRDWGVATTIDSNDSTISNFSRPFLRGILAHSYTSLQSLFLSGFETLQKDDLHPAIPHLRNLRSLDVTRCHDLDDSTMILLSQHVSRTLQVLYLKGLRKVSDLGIRRICDTCDKLEVLEISHVLITDEGGVAIARLSKLRALFMRDNYQLTNVSIDAITGNCTRLAQLTLWGCIRIQHLRFDNTYNNHSSVHHRLAFGSSGKLVILNLWGCHGLKDEAAEFFGNMKNLNSLIVSECHRLTDRFVEILASTAPNLQHLHLRYCKRLTDSAVHAIAKSMRRLYSLDLTFCSRITATALANLLEIRHDCLAELRLKSCRSLGIGRNGTSSSATHGGTGRNNNNNNGTDGRLILRAIQSHPAHCLCILDVRDCGGQPGPADAYPLDDPFVVGLKAMEFEQRVPGFFSRKSRWSSVQQHMIDHHTIHQTSPAT